MCLGDGQAWKDLSFNKNYAKRQSLKLQGKSGPMVSIEQSLTRDGLFELWFGAACCELCNVPGDYRRVEHCIGDAEFALVDFDRGVAHVYCEESWKELASCVNQSLGIRDADDMPTLVHDLKEYLIDSRHFRARFPQLDRISKRAFHSIHQETTWNKFRASYGYQEIVHVGCGMIGRMSCIGCPDAVLCDPLMNGLKWEELDLGEGGGRKRVVSDVSLMNDSKTGMGEDPLLYTEMRKGPSLYKVNFHCLSDEDNPIYKGRDHNEEVIAVSDSWGPSTAVEVNRDTIVEVNGLRNILCQRMLQYSAIRRAPTRAQVNFPDVGNPDFGTFFSFSDTQEHIRNQLRHVSVRRTHDHRVPCAAFDQDMFTRLLECSEAYFNPSQPVPQKLFEQLKEKSLAQLRVCLPNSGLTAVQAANVYLWRDAVKGKRLRLDLANAMVDMKVE